MCPKYFWSRNWAPTPLKRLITRHILQIFVAWYRTSSTVRKHVVCHTKIIFYLVEISQWWTSVKHLMTVKTWNEYLVDDEIVFVEICAYVCILVSSFLVSNATWEKFWPNCELWWRDEVDLLLVLFSCKFPLKSASVPCSFSGQATEKLRLCPCVQGLTSLNILFWLTFA